MKRIWKYSPASRDVEEGEVRSDQCLFCRTDLDTVEKHRSDLGRETNITTTLRACPICGWWSIYQLHAEPYYPELGSSSAGAKGVLRELDLADVSLPLDEVRAYLVAKYSSRFEVHPRVFEDVVVQVFKSLRYDVAATAYRGDGGIDAVLYTPDGENIGVQVKRSKNAIEAEQIRAFVGALVLNGHTKGIYVTTSRYRSGALGVTLEAESQLGLPVELWDAPRFYSALKLSRRRPYSSVSLKLLSYRVELESFGYQSYGHAY